MIQRWIGTFEALVARVASYVIQYYDDVRAFDYGVEIDNVERLPEVAAAVVAEHARYAEQTRAQRKREYLRLKAEFEPATVKDTSA